MLSFEIHPTTNNQTTGDIKYGSEVKVQFVDVIVYTNVFTLMFLQQLMHVNSKKFVTLGRGDIHLDSMDRLVSTIRAT